MFTPAGAEAKWRMVYPVLAAVPTGDVLTYEAMATALGLPTDCDRKLLFGPFRQAAQVHEEQDHRAVESVRGVGYRVVGAAEHLRLAHRHNRRAGNQLELGRSKLVNVDLSDVDPEIRKGFEVLGLAFGQQAEINRRMDSRHRRQAKALDIVTKTTERNTEEVNELKARLAASEDRLAQIEATVKGVQGAAS